MFKYGLLFLSCRPSHLSSLLSDVGSYLKVANTKISSTLYVSLDFNKRLTSKNVDTSALNVVDFIKLVPKIYVEAHKYAPRLDVRVLHQYYYHSSSANEPSTKRVLNYSPEVVLLNENFSDDLIKNYLHNQFDFSAQTLPIIRLNNISNDTSTPVSNNLTNEQTFDNVCIGGTFDNLHNGHKILLSTAQLKCNKSLTIGVTDESMVRNKTLFELIEKPEKRIEKLNHYLQDVDPFINYNVVRISDPFGPAIVDESLQAIIVSEETVRGGHKINEIRSSKSMPELKLEAIKVLDDDHKENDAEEEKVSSSSNRMRKLGTLLKKPKDNKAKRPYIIGLTGMIASGKSAISDKLRKLGAGVVNVDLLAHQTYSSPSALAYKDIVQTFGKQILDEDCNINRRKLGQIVFDDDAKRKQLNDIIWPRVEQLLKEQINQLKSKYDIIVLEIALLVEANWMHKVDQVWLTILNEKETIRRLQIRNQLSEEESIQRIRSLMPCQEKIKYANVVFCTQWEEEFTWQQVKRAWKMLNDRYVEK